MVGVSDDGARLQVLRALTDSRYEVLANVDRGLELLPHVAQFSPEVVVLEVTVLGTLGFRLFAMMHLLAPMAAIIVLAPALTYDVAAVEAGAHAVVPMDDPRRLRDVLDALARSSAV